MSKDIIISILAAELLMQHPWYIGCAGAERMAIVVGTATVVFIFLLFLEDLWDKYRKYRRRVQKVRRTVRNLQKGAGNGKSRTYFIGTGYTEDDK